MTYLTRALLVIAYVLSLPGYALLLCATILHDLVRGGGK